MSKSVVYPQNVRLQAISHLENSITLMETLLSHHAAERVTEIE